MTWNLRMLLVAFWFMFASSVSAFTAQEGEQVILNDLVQDDLYVVGGDISANTKIEWDFYSAGGNIRVDGEVTQDLNLAGGNITVWWLIWDDVRIAGGDITIDADIQWDLIIFGWTVRIDPGTMIWGDLIVAAGEVFLNWEVWWNLDLNVGSLVMNWLVRWNAKLGLERIVSIWTEARINWDLNYIAKKQLVWLEEIIGGTVVFEQSILPQGKHAQKMFLKGTLIWLFLNLLGVVLFACLLIFGLPKLFAESALKLKSNPFKSLWLGLGILVWIPVLVLILMITVIGMPIWLFGLMLYIFLIVFSELIWTCVFSVWLINMFKKPLRRLPKLAIIVWVAFVFVFLNWLDFIATIFAWWALVLAFHSKGVELLKCETKASKKK